jgi:ketosteroid isomerase-like protein
MVGKPAIAAMMNAMTTQFKGAHMEKFEMRCSAIEVSGDMASEWCVEHQIVDLNNGKPPFVGWGKMLLVLRRGADGKWRLLREMWNQAEAE